MVIGKSLATAGSTPQRSETPASNVDIADID
jgi:hypothetical protein